MTIPFNIFRTDLTDHYPFNSLLFIIKFSFPLRSLKQVFEWSPKPTSKHESWISIEALKLRDHYPFISLLFFIFPFYYGPLNRSSNWVRNPLRNMIHGEASKHWSPEIRFEKKMELNPLGTVRKRFNPRDTIRKEKGFNWSLKWYVRATCCSWWKRFCLFF